MLLPRRPPMPPATSVLIVDDEPAIRELMARWVQALGLQPRTAASAEEAIVSLRARHCDLAVIDVMMPGQNGLWLAGEMRRDHPHTAVVLATGYTELLQGSSQAIADLLIKPIKRERFVLALDRGIEWRRQAIEELEWHARLSTELADGSATSAPTSPPHGNAARMKQRCWSRSQWSGRRR